MRLRHDTHAPPLRRIAGLVVVIAAHERERERRMRGAPHEKAASSAATRPAAACRKSPRITRRCAPVRDDERRKPREVAPACRRAAAARHRRGMRRPCRGARLRRTAWLRASSTARAPRGGAPVHPRSWSRGTPAARRACGARCCAVRSSGIGVCNPVDGTRNCASGATAVIECPRSVLEMDRMRRNDWSLVCASRCGSTRRSAH